MATLTQLQTLINALGSGEKNTAEEMRAILNAFSTSLYLTGDVKEIDCDETYRLLNFDATGLGINERVGWAICNGLNGTKDRNGRTGIGFGSAYPTLGALGGSKDHVLSVAEMPSHSHVINEVYNENNQGTKVGSGGGTLEAVGTQNVSSTGGGSPHNNMQPYIVSLFIQKL